MKEIVMRDEQVMLNEVVKSPVALINKILRPKSVYFAGDNNFVCDYLLKTYQSLNKDGHMEKSPTYLSTGIENEYRQTTLAEIGDVVPLESLRYLDGKSVIFFFVDCVNGLKDKETTLAALNTITGLLKKNKRSKCVVSILLPSIPSFSSEVEKLSEREYNFFIEKQCERTPEIDYYIEIEKCCRRAVVTENVNIVLARFDNVFAPDMAHTPDFDLKGIIQDCHNSKKICITDEDVQKCYTITYIRSACHAIPTLAVKGRKGNIYNIASEAVSLESIKRMLYYANPETYALNTTLSANVTPQYCGLNNLKYVKLGGKTENFTKSGIKHFVAYHTGEQYDTSPNTSFYGGKIKRIQALEIKILKEIDDICRRNDIKYFLAGGTLLGAVRSGKAIPWDDDLDIGMLREDFEKFREVCPRELSPEFSYSSTFNRSGSHYTIDKVRLEDTYFSTNFSNKNQFRDGIFVDILVYDKTSNNPVCQRLHSLILTSLTRIMEIKWFNVPRKKFHYKFSKTFLPLLRSIPWYIFNKLFDHFAKFYRYKKDAKWLIDSVGKKVNAAPLPNQGLDDVVYVEFEGIMAPIPVDPVPYLTYAYGQAYMQEPVLSKRRCPHNFARIDLGKYVFDDQGNVPFRKVHVKGELFECENEL